MIFELDFLPEVIAAKQATLSLNRVDYPSTIRLVGCDLIHDDPFEKLIAGGYDHDRPAAVFLEGVSLFLPPEATARVIDPATLHLATGSRIHFDFRTRDKSRSRNAKWARLGATKTYGEFPFPDEPSALSATLGEIGYRSIIITRLDESMRQRWPDSALARAADTGRIMVDAARN